MRHLFGLLCCSTGLNVYDGLSHEEEKEIVQSLTLEKHPSEKEGISGGRSVDKRGRFFFARKISSGFPCSSRISTLSVGKKKEKKSSQKYSTLRKNKHTCVFCLPTAFAV